MLALNAGCQCGSEAGFLAVMAEIRHRMGVIDAVFFSEFDACEGAMTYDTVGWDVSRHRAHGGHNMAFIIKSSLGHLVQEVRWRRRCGMAVLRSGVSEGRYHAAKIAFVHGPHAGDELEEMFVDLSKLLTSAKQCVCSTICLGDWNIDVRPVISLIL